MAPLCFSMIFIITRIGLKPLGKRQGLCAFFLCPTILHNDSLCSGWSMLYVLFTTHIKSKSPTSHSAMSIDNIIYQSSFTTSSPVLFSVIYWIIFRSMLFFVMKSCCIKGRQFKNKFNESLMLTYWLKLLNTYDTNESYSRFINEYLRQFDASLS